MLTRPAVFVTGTDTDAGKSFITAALVRGLIEAGLDAAALKPVSCGRGIGELNADVAALLAAQGMAANRAGDINLYDFAPFAAPMFAAPPGDGVDVAKLAAWCGQRVAGHALTLIEGVGGLMVPLAEGVLVADWLQMLAGAKVLLVVRARLGGINQALLSIDKLERMGCAPDWVVVNAADAQGNAMLDDHCAAISPYFAESTTLLQMPFSPDAGEAGRNIKDNPLFAALEAMMM